MSALTKKFKKAKNRSNKVNLVFDEEKRKEFLTGFHKRKQQRKKKAQEKLENQLKEERKRLKSEIKQSYKKLVVSNRLIPELPESSQNEYEDDDVTVQIMDLSSNIIKEDQQINPNETAENKCLKKIEVPGMELNPATEPILNAPNKQFSSEKQIKSLLKKTATKNVQKSSIFQKKNKLERNKQRKKSLQQKAQKLKQGKGLRKKHKQHVRH
ncbi:nucleolar protein 12 [Holotrichia oblita]|uniref:Nucleolar protein 12 n=1 Tax=Holotrichia oblita TaxID=644536 RepID=A0ACB9SKP4_HOLOL|nr:nucleolar protein 12 [Holotrichia oblita]